MGLFQAFPGRQTDLPSSTRPAGWLQNLGTPAPTRLGCWGVENKQLGILNMMHNYVSTECKRLYTKKSGQQNSTSRSFISEDFICIDKATQGSKSAC